MRMEVKLEKMKRLAAMALVAAAFIGLSSRTAFAYSNYRFFNIVQQVCKAYRVYVDMADMYLNQAADDHLVFTVELNSGRNNFDTAMLAAFLGVGKALNRVQELDVNTVEVKIRINARENNLIIATADANDIVRYANGSLSYKDFKESLTVI